MEKPGLEWNSEPSSNDVKLFTRTFKYLQQQRLTQRKNTKRLKTYFCFKKPLISGTNFKTLKSWNVKSWISCPFTPFRTWKNCLAVTKLQLHSQTSLRQLISDTLYLNMGRGGPSSGYSLQMQPWGENQHSTSLSDQRSDPHEGTVISYPLAVWVFFGKVVKF